MKIFSNIECGFQKNTRFYNVPSIMLTVAGCNLKCMFGNKICSHAFQNGTYTAADAKEFVNANTNLNHIVICGGEPLLYKNELEKFLDDIWRDDLKVTICTNGTLPILNPLSKRYKIALYVVNIYDRKLPNAGKEITNPVTGKKFVFGTNDIERMHNGINYEVLRNICLYSTDYLLCFNASPDKLLNKSNDVVEQICKSEDEYILNMLHRYSPEHHVVFMPRSKKDTDAVKRICLENGIYYNEL